MNHYQKALVIDPPAEVEKISNFLQEKFSQLNRQTVIVGVSGGLDSSLVAALSINSFGPDKVRLYYLPERDSKSIHRQHAHLIARHLKSDLITISITPALRSLKIYSLLPLNLFPGQYMRSKAVEYGKRKFLEHTRGEFLSARLNGSGGPWIARGNAYASSKHRVRSVVLYREAERYHGLVIGAANRTEWMTGTFTQYGCDHNADIMPLIHLYRSQIQYLAEYLCLPEEIIRKKADPDVLPGLDDKGQLLGSFEEADQILWGFENNILLSHLYEDHDPDQVDHISNLVKNSAYYREAPYSLL